MVLMLVSFFFVTKQYSSTDASDYAGIMVRDLACYVVVQTTDIGEPMENPIFRPLDSLILGGSVWQNNKSSLLSEAFAQQRTCLYPIALIS